MDQKQKNKNRINKIKKTGQAARRIAAMRSEKFGNGELWTLAMKKEAVEREEMETGEVASKMEEERSCLSQTSLYRQAKAGPLTVMNDWLLIKPVHVTEFIHGNIDLFAGKSHVATCVVEPDGSYYYVMQPISKEIEQEVETNGIWEVERFVEERTRVGPKGVVYGVQFERFPDVYSIQSADVQNGPLKAEARRTV